MIAFVDFCRTALGLTLSPAWTVLASVAVDGVEPRDLTGADRELARRLFGDEVDEIPEVARRTIVLRLGRGSGKSTMSAALSVYAAFTSSLATVGPGMLAASVIVAPGLKTARIALRVARELVRASRLEKFVSPVADSTESFDTRRPDGKTVTILAVAASRGGASLRGFDLLSILFDESEQFNSSSEVASADVHVSDRDLYAAASPRLHGLAVFASTPWPVSTLTSELVKENFGAPRDALVAIGPSLLMRPDDKRLAARFALEMKRDSLNARREFGAEDIDSGSGFFDVAAIERAIATMPPERTSGGRCTAAVDLGFVRDASALVILEHRRDGTVACVHVDTVRPTKGSPIIPSVLFQRFAPAIHAHGCSVIHSDSFNAASTRELVQAHRLTLQVHTESRDTKATRYMALRDAISRDRVSLPNDKRLIDGLKSIVGKAQNGGTMAISAPRRAGHGHADAVSALVLAHHAMGQGYAASECDDMAVRLQAIVRNATPNDGSRRFRGMITPWDD